MGKAMSEESTKVVMPFEVKDCALIAMATGRRAQNLRELAMHLAQISSGSIYHHFWGGLLRPGFDDPEYQNDFAGWARHALHDKQLAERLAIVDPTACADLEELRQELLDVIEDRIDESEVVPWSVADQQFHFMQSQIVVFDTGIRVDHPGQLCEIIPTLSVGSIFYHFIDARRRDPDCTNDFSRWLMGIDLGTGEILESIETLDPYFSSLTELRDQLGVIFHEQFGGGES